MAKPTALPRQSSARRWPRRAALALGAVLIALVLLAWPSMRGYARVGTAYGARVGCSCRFVGHRSLADCSKDFEPGMGLVRLNEDPASQTVTARIPLLASARATFRAADGCQLEPWPGS